MVLEGWFALVAVLVTLGIAAVCLWIARTSRARAHRLQGDVRDRTAELERALEQLRDAHVRQEDFVARVSHELFTPLTTIRGTMSMLSEPSAVSVQEIPTVVEMAARSSERMTQLVDDLMLAAGLTESVSYERVPFDLAEQVGAALDGFEPFRKDVRMDVDPGTRALGDAERFRIALRHLLSNADRFGPPDSTIRIEGSTNNGRVSVTVSDDGPGIPRDRREAAFERFTRFGGAVNRAHEGLGLGLFIARRTVRAMGGDVTIEDEPRGCAVRIWVPSGERRAGHFGRKSAAAAIAATLVFFSGASAAITGRLPAPLQDAAARVAEFVGVDLPRSGERAGVSRSEDASELDENVEDRAPGSSVPDAGTGGGVPVEPTGGASEGDPVGGVPDVGGSSGGLGGTVEDTTGKLGDTAGELEDTVGDVGEKAGGTVDETVDELGGTAEDTVGELEETAGGLLGK